MSLFDTGIRPAIDDYLRKESEKIRDYGKYWSASSAGYCMRLNMMKRLGVKPVPEIEESTDRQTRVFEAGHIFHEWAQRITTNAGLSIAQELELQDEELMIRGHIDDLVLIKGTAALEVGEIVAVKDVENPVEIFEAQRLILYDYKTANSQAFNYAKETIGHYHKMQLGTYMYLLRQKNWLARRATKFDLEPKSAPANTKDVTEGRILQISKDDLRMREFQLLWSPALEKQVVEYWTTLQGYWEKKMLPKCTCLDYDGGFMGRRSKKGKVYNPYFYKDEPCSTMWYELWKKEQNDKV